MAEKASKFIANIKIFMFNESVKIESLRISDATHFEN